MHKMETSRKNSPWLLVIAIFLVTGLACNLPRPLDHDEFVCESAGGYWIIDESGARCKFAPEDDEAPAEDPGGQSSIPADTYTGEFIETDMGTKGLVEWKVQGAVEKNEVILQVAADGTVTGSLAYEKIGNILVSDSSGCTDSNDQFFTGAASGQISGNTGRLVFAIQQTIVSRLSAACSIGPSEKTLVKDLRQHFEIAITGNEMVGTGIPSDQDGFPVKGTFRLVKK
jgi:hypothetical protein